MKTIKFFLVFTFIISPLAITAQPEVTVSIQNNSVLERKAAVVTIPWKNVVSQYPQIDTTNFVMINSVTKKQIPFQLEHLGLPTINNLLVQVDVKAKAMLPVFIQKGKPSFYC